VSISRHDSEAAPVVTQRPPPAAQSTSTTRQTGHTRMADARVATETPLGPPAPTDERVTTCGGFSTPIAVHWMRWMTSTDLTRGGTRFAYRYESTAALLPAPERAQRQQQHLTVRRHAYHFSMASAS
jgi:hypothetical protein